MACMLTAACSFDPSGVNGGGSADASAVDGPPAGCTAGTITCGDADTLQVCRADGSGQDPQACALGCVDTPAPHCGDIVPSNGISAELIDLGIGTLDTAATGSLVFDSDFGRIATEDGTEIRPAGVDSGGSTGIAFAVVPQQGGPSIGVFLLGDLTVAPGTTLRGIGVNALGLVSRDTVTIAGVIDVTGGVDACPASPSVQDAAQCPGPGGNAGGDPDTTAPGAGAGVGGDGSDSFGESGGGGGGHGDTGGDGGLGGAIASGAGGGAFGASSLVPLTGGGGGGGGGDELSFANVGATGGGGGGGIQIVARTAILLDSAAAAPCGINAGGGGAGVPEFSAGGGGGGAGGGILLEAPAISLGENCVLAANGGGGSGGSGAVPGRTGLLDDTAAAGSAGDADRGNGDGGAGGFGNAPGGRSGGDAAVNEGGGGGGGAGIIRVNTRDGNGLDAAGVVSPLAGIGSVVIE